MRIAPLLTLLLLIPVLAPAAELKWYTDLNVAKAVAKEENKTILIVFTGSDWCSDCAKLKHDILDTPEFAAYASEKLVLMVVDFPHITPLPDNQQKANRKLYQAYLVPGFPTLVLADAEGKSKGQESYAAAGPSASGLAAGGLAAGGPKLFLSRIDSKITGIPLPALPPDQAGSKDRPSGTATEDLAFPPDEELKLTGISGFKKHRLALINGRSFEVDDQEKFSMNGKQVTIKCIEIGTDTVRILVNGTERVLKLRL